MQRKKEVLQIIVLQLIIIIVFSLIYYFVGSDNFIYTQTGQNVSKKLEYLDFLYFSTVTSASTGYGDIIPNTNLARILVTIQILITYTTIFRVFFVYKFK